MDSSADDARRIKELTDQVASLHDEVRRLETALESSRAFGTEQAAAAAQLRSQLDAPRRAHASGMIRRFRHAVGRSARLLRQR